MSKNDLSAFRRKPTTEKVLTEPALESSKGGAPKKLVKDKQSHRVQTMLTEAEFEKLEMARGAVSMSAYLRIQLKEHGII